MFSSLAAVLLVSSPPLLHTLPKIPTLARPLASWAAGDVERSYRLDLYARGDCVLHIGSAALATSTAVACRWSPSEEGISIQRRSPYSRQPFVLGSEAAEFRVLEDGQAIQAIDDPRFTLHRVR